MMVSSSFFFVLLLACFSCGAWAQSGANLLTAAQAGCETGSNALPPTWAGSTSIHTCSTNANAVWDGARGFFRNSGSGLNPLRFDFPVGGPDKKAGFYGRFRQGGTGSTAHVRIIQRDSGGVVISTQVDSTSSNSWAAFNLFASGSSPGTLDTSTAVVRLELDCEAGTTTSCAFDGLYAWTEGNSAGTSSCTDFFAQCGSFPTSSGTLTCAPCATDRTCVGATCVCNAMTEVSNCGAAATANTKCAGTLSNACGNSVTCTNRCSPGTTDLTCDGTTQTCTCPAVTEVSECGASGTANTICNGQQGNLCGNSVTCTDRCGVSNVNMVCNTTQSPARCGCTPLSCGPRQTSGSKCETTLTNSCSSLTCGVCGGTGWQCDGSKNCVCPTPTQDTLCGPAGTNNSQCSGSVTNGCGNSVTCTNRCSSGNADLYCNPGVSPNRCACSALEDCGPRRTDGSWCDNHLLANSCSSKTCGSCGSDDWLCNTGTDRCYCPTPICQAGVDCGVSGKLTNLCGGTVDCSTNACSSGRVCNTNLGKCECPQLTNADCSGKCGTIENQCGNSFNCPSCGQDQTCVDNGGLNNFCRCNAVTCATTTPPGEATHDCGIKTNACLNNANCGGCALPFTCNSGKCSCIPVTCSQLGKQCGTLPDQCFSQANCGTCPQGQKCTPDLVCIPDVCVETRSCATSVPPRTCGTLNTGCANVTCGSCPSGQPCGSNGVCICTPTLACSAFNVTCGPWYDGCTTISCGSCGSEETCASGVCVAGGPSEGVESSSEQGSDSSGTTIIIIVVVVVVVLLLVAGVAFLLWRRQSGEKKESVELNDNPSVMVYGSTSNVSEGGASDANPVYGKATKVTEYASANDVAEEETSEEVVYQDLNAFNDE